MAILSVTTQQNSCYLFSFSYREDVYYADTSAENQAVSFTLIIITFLLLKKVVEMYLSFFQISVDEWAPVDTNGREGIFVVLQTWIIFSIEL